MKKKKAARVRSVSSPKKRKYTAGVVLFILFLIAVVGAIVFVVISKNPAKTPHAAELGVQTSIGWRRPTGIVLAKGIKSGRIGTCNSTNVYCGVGFYTFSANESVNYSVVYNTPDNKSIIIKQSTTQAAPDGSAKFGWDWTYTVVLYPSRIGSCDPNQGCLLFSEVISHSTSSVFSFPIIDYKNKLWYHTQYVVKVCTPNCGNGGLIANVDPSTISAGGITCVVADVNGDYRVNSVDLGLISSNYSPPKAFNSLYDINGDGKVDSTDLGIAGSNFGSYKQCG